MTWPRFFSDFDGSGWKTFREAPTRQDGELFFAALTMTFGVIARLDRAI
jgi:hypothetical protein